MRRRSLLALPLIPVPALAQSETYEAAEQSILAGRLASPTGITIEMPVLSENGNSVDISVRVESPSTRGDHVTTIHILAEKNPIPRVASFTLGPRSGRAEVATRIRLATTQTILVLAETSRGQVHRAAREVIVILGACVDGG